MVIIYYSYAFTSFGFITVFILASTIFICSLFSRRFVLILCVSCLTLTPSSSSSSSSSSFFLLKRKREEEEREEKRKERYDDDSGNKTSILCYFYSDSVGLKLYMSSFCCGHIFFLCNQLMNGLKYCIRGNRCVFFFIIPPSLLPSFLPSFFPYIFPTFWQPLFSPFHLDLLFHFFQFFFTIILTSLFPETITGGPFFSSLSLSLSLTISLHSVCPWIFKIVGGKNINENCVSR